MRQAKTTVALAANDCRSRYVRQHIKNGHVLPSLWRSNEQHRAGSTCRPGVRFSVQGTQHCRPRLQSLAGAPGCARDPPVHRHGLRLQRVLAAAVEGCRRSRTLGAAPPAPRSLPSCSSPTCDWKVSHARLDVHAVLRVSRLVGRAVRRLARARRTAQGRPGGDALLVRRPADRGVRHSHPSAVADAGSAPA